MAVGRALRLYITKYGSWDGAWVVPGIAPSQAPPVPTTPGTPLPYPTVVLMTSVLPRGAAAQKNSVVGLKSVEQLSLSTQISGFQGMTEVYNLSAAGIPNDQKCIPGTE